MLALRFLASPLPAFTAGLLLGLSFAFVSNFHFEALNDTDSYWLWRNRFDNKADAQKLLEDNNARPKLLKGSR